MLIAGVDLAWGERQGDGVCLVRLHSRTPECAEVVLHTHQHGDDALVQTLTSRLNRPDEAIFVAVDAPVVCRNATGRRPADAEVSATFRHVHAGCYPVNQKLAQRPLRLARRMADAEGFTLAPAPDVSRPWPDTGWRVAAEVFPHPAIVRFFGLERILEYKRKAGRSATHAAQEFKRLQSGLLQLMSRRFPGLKLADPTVALLNAPWSKSTEDQVDALVCALVGLWHVRHDGLETEIFGDKHDGFVLVPRIPRLERLRIT